MEELTAVSQKLYDHESKLAKVETILERVALNQDKMAEAVSQISSSIVKQELILEKLSFLETNSKGSFERIHLRIDGVTDLIVATNERIGILDDKVIENTQQIKYFEEELHDDKEKLKDLEIFSLLQRYPIASGLIGLGLYSLTFESTRELVGSILGLLG